MNIFQTFNLFSDVRQNYFARQNIFNYLCRNSTLPPKMQFRQEYKPEKTLDILSIHRPVLLMGSCFAENIYKRMNDALWSAVNPGGVLYNPLSVAKALRLFLLLYPDGEFAESIFKAPNGLFHSMLFDSSLYGRTHRELTERFVQRRKSAHDFMNNGADIIITLGSSYCYFLNKTIPLLNEYPVGNCHKLPQNNFNLRLLETPQIVSIWKTLISEIRGIWPDTRFIFTISPLRYTSYGIENNSLSKAILRVAINDIIKDLDNVSYFPAYEIVNDDLRDYRFYAEDMVHPSKQAVDYIWEKFKEKYLDSKQIELLDKGWAITKALAHRPILPETDQKRWARMEKVRQKYEVIKNDWKNSLDPFPLSAF